MDGRSLPRAWPALRASLAGARAAVLRRCHLAAGAVVRARRFLRPRTGPGRLHSEDPPLARVPSVPLLEAVPRELLVSVVAQLHRGDLCAIARSASAAKNLSELCSPYLQRGVACRNCLTVLHHPRDVASVITSEGFPSSHRGAAIFEDGTAVALHRWPLGGSGLSVSPGPVAESGISEKRLLQRIQSVMTHTSNGFRAQSEALGLPAACQTVPVACPDNQEASRARLHRLICSGCALYVGELVYSNDVMIPLICKSYVQDVDNWGRCADSDTPHYLRCSGARRTRGHGGCGQILCEGGDVLSRCHCWAPPGADVEDAWYINAYKAGTVAASPARLERLGQGVMQVADVNCTACGGAVGWKFVQDCSDSEPNRHQVGRFGLCVSSIQGYHAPCFGTTEV